MTGQRRRAAQARPPAGTAPAGARRRTLASGRSRAVVLGALLCAALVGAPAVAAGAAAVATPQQLQEARWRAWVGCWRLEGRRTDARPDPAEGVREVCFEPVGAAVRLVSRVDGRPVLERLLFADGVERPFEQAGCQGSERHFWSADGERLFTLSRARCNDGSERAASGVALRTDRDAWLDIQVIASDGQREVVVRRYRAVEAAPEPAPMGAGFDALVGGGAGGTGRLDVGDVVEAAGAIDVAAVEAMLVETRASFDLDARTLVRLADRGLPENLIDLMVALSFPQDFVVEGVDAEVRQQPSEPARGVLPPAAAPGYWSAWFAPFGYGLPYDYYYYPAGFGVLVHPHARFGGRVIAGHGYARVRPAPASGTGGLRSGRRHGAGGGAGSGGRVTPAGTSRGGSKTTGRRAKPRGRR